MIGRCIVFSITDKFNQGLTIFNTNYALLTCSLIYVLVLNSLVTMYSYTNRKKLTLKFIETVITKKLLIVGVVILSAFFDLLAKIGPISMVQITMTFYIVEESMSAIKALKKLGIKTPARLVKLIKEKLNDK
jgi:hypothetical protein